MLLLASEVPGALRPRRASLVPHGGKGALIKIVHNAINSYLVDGTRRRMPPLPAGNNMLPGLSERPQTLLDLECLANEGDQSGVAACVEIAARLRGYLQQGDLLMQQLALQEMMGLATSKQLPFRSLVEQQLLDDLILQLQGPLSIVSLAAEVLCRLVDPAAVEEFHLLLQPCVPLLLGVVARHQAPGGEEVPAVFFALSMLGRLCGSATLASAAIKGGGVQVLVGALDVVPATVCQASILALFRLVRQPQGPCQPALTQAAQAGAFGRLCKVLQHVSGSTGDMAFAIMCELVQIEAARQTIAEQGGIPALVQLMRGPSHDVAVRAMLVLGRLCSRRADWQRAAVDLGAMDVLVRLAEGCCDEHRAHVWRTLAVLLQHSTTHEAAKDSGAIQPLLASLTDEGSSDACKEQALSALALMGQNPATHGHLLGWGLLPVLVPLLSQQHPTLRLYALMMAMMLSSHQQRHACLVGSSGALPVLVSIVRQGGPGNSAQYAAATIASLANDVQLQSDVVAAGAIPACIRLLDSASHECVCHAAEVLLHLASSTPVRRRLIARAGAMEPLYNLLLSTSPPVQCAAAHLLQVLSQEACVAEELAHSDKALLHISMLLAASRHSDFAAGDLQPAKARAAWLLAGLAAHDYHRARLKEHELVGPLVRMLGIRTHSRTPATELAAGMETSCRVAATAALLTMSRLDEQLAAQVLQQLSLQVWLGNNITLPGLIISH